MCAYSKNNSFSVPPWIKTADVAVWIADHFNNICYINSKAEKLFERRASDCIGLPCYRLDGCKNYLSSSITNSVYTMSEQFNFKFPIDLIDIYITSSNGIEQKINVLIISVQHPNPHQSWLVHCALGNNKDQLIEDYLYRISTRSPHDTIELSHRNNPMLSKREDQILQLLSKDKCMKEIAFDLHLSYATIRNHVHHILSKLKVHSIVEAIAFNLLKKKK